MKAIETVDTVETKEIGVYCSLVLFTKYRVLECNRFCSSRTAHLWTFARVACKKESAVGHIYTVLGKIVVFISCVEVDSDIGSYCLLIFFF